MMLQSMTKIPAIRKRNEPPKCLDGTPNSSKSTRKSSSVRRHKKSTFLTFFEDIILAANSLDICRLEDFACMLVRDQIRASTPGEKRTKVS